MTTLTIVEIVGREFTFYTPYLRSIEFESTKKEFSEGAGEEFKVISGDNAFVFRLRPSTDKMKVDFAHQRKDYRRATWIGKRVNPKRYTDMHYLLDPTHITIYVLTSGQDKVRICDITKDQFSEIQEINYQNQQTF